MQAILYVAHGSRLKAGNEEAISFINQVKKEIYVSIQEISFLELAHPTIMQGIENCIQKGATNIAVVPILLLTAHHAKVDIPTELEKARKKYPQLRVTYGRPFGIHPRLIESVHNRILEQENIVSQTAEVLLIGRGSSDESVYRDLNIIAMQLKKRYGFKNVNICFLYGKGPLLDETLDQVKEKNISKLFIVPYLLFTGLLKKTIQNKIVQKSLDFNRVVLCESLGYDENVHKVLYERVREVLLMSNNH